MPDLVLAGIPVLLIIVGLVEYVKSLGLPAKYAPVVAIVVGIGAGLLNEAMVVYPAIEPWVVAAVSGVVVGMAATGLYKVGSRWTGPR